MNILSPTDTNHQLKIIPRYYPVGSITLELKNEASGMPTTIEVTPVVLDGYMYLDFQMVLTDNSSYQIKITANNEVVYRGKLFVTNQSDNTQAYKISKDIFRI